MAAPLETHLYPALRGGTVTRLSALVAALFGFAVGIVMTLRADLGLGPWDVLHQGIALHTPLSFGVAAIVVGVVIICASMLLGIRPGWGTVLNALLVGTFIDLVIAAEVIPDPAPEELAARLLLVVSGVLIIGVGTAIYIGAGLGAGPRDSFMLALTARTPLPLSAARTIIELSALAAGAALGGAVGVGTLIFAFGIGPAVHASFWVLGRSPLALPVAVACD